MALYVPLIELDRHFLAFVPSLFMSLFFKRDICFFARGSVLGAKTMDAILSAGKASSFSRKYRPCFYIFSSMTRVCHRYMLGNRDVSNFELGNREVLIFELTGVHAAYPPFVCGCARRSSNLQDILHSEMGYLGHKGAEAYGESA